MASVYKTQHATDIQVNFEKQEIPSVTPLDTQAETIRRRIQVHRQKIHPGSSRQSPKVDQLTVYYCFLGLQKLIGILRETVLKRDKSSRIYNFIRSSFPIHEYGHSPLLIRCFMCSEYIISKQYLSQQPQKDHKKDDQSLSMAFNILHKNLIHFLLNFFLYVFLLLWRIIGLYFQMFIAGYRNATGIYMVISCPANLNSYKS